MLVGKACGEGGVVGTIADAGVLSAGGGEEGGGEVVCEVVRGV